MSSWCHFRVPLIPASSDALGDDGFAVDRTTFAGVSIPKYLAAKRSDVAPERVPRRYFVATTGDCVDPAYWERPRAVTSMTSTTTSSWTSQMTS